MKTSRLYIQKYLAIVLCFFGVNSLLAQDCTPPGDFSMFTPSASQIGETSVSLSWVNTTRHNSFTVQKRLSGGGSYTNVATVSSSQNTYTVTGLSSGTTYEFRVLANYTCCTDDGGGGGTEPLSFTCEDYVWPSTNTKTVITEPSTPTIRSAISITSSSFTARWFTVTGASSYVLRVKRGSITVYGPTDVGNVSSKTISSLSPGEEYTYQVYAKNSSGSSSYSGTTSLETLAEVPVATSATQITQTSARLNWNAADGATDYRYSFYDEDLTFQDGAITSNLYFDIATRFTLSPGTVYQYRVRSRNDNGSLSDFSNYKSFITVPTEPVANVPGGSDIFAGQFRARWSQVTGASGYTIEVSATEDFSTILATESVGAVSSAMISGFDPGQDYYFRVQANNVSGSSGYSNAISIETLGETPVPQPASAIEQTSFQANWQAAEGATDYRLYVSTTSDMSTSDVLDGQEVTGTSYELTGLNAGGTYYFAIKSANDADGLSPLSAVESVLLKPADPVASEGSDITSTGFVANWDVSNGASTYYMDVATDAGFGETLPDYNNLEVGNVTSAGVTGLNPGTDYFFRVRGGNGNGISFDSDIRAVETRAEVPEVTAPSSITTDAFIAHWVEEPSASGYFLEVASDSEFNSLLTGYDPLVIGDGNIIEAAVNGLDAGNTYYYRVHSSNDNGLSSGPSADQTVTLVPADPVAVDATELAQDAFTARWNIANGASDYELDVSREDETFSPAHLELDGALITGGATTSYRVESLAPGLTYHFRLKAKNQNGKSGYSNVISLLLPPADPNAPSFQSIATDSLVVSWEEVVGASSYILSVAGDDQFLLPLAGYPTEVTDLRDTIRGLTAGTQYFFKVKAKNTSGESNFSPVGSKFTIPDAPVVQAPTNPDQTGFTANWLPVDGATGYEIACDTSETFDSELFLIHSVADGDTSTATVSNLHPGIQYHIKVRAVNESGKSAYSDLETILLIPANPQPPVPTIVSAGAFTLAWDAVAGGTAYELEVSETSAFGGDRLAGYNPAILSDTTKGIDFLEPGETYFYRVLAKNATGKSGFSQVDSVITNPDAPVIKSPTNPSQTGFTVNWESSFGASGYRVYVDTIATLDSEFLFSADASGATSSSHQVDGLTPGLNYYLRVSALNADGESGKSDLESILLIPADPNAPSVAAAGQDSLVLNWDEVTGCDQYSLEIADDADFTELLSGYPKVTGSLRDTVRGLQSGSEYFFRLRASNGAGTSGYSPAGYAVTIPPAPMVGGASSPAQSSFMASWLTVAGANGYNIQVDTTSDFDSELAINIRVSDGSSGEQVVDSLEAGETYFFRIRAFNASGYSPYSEEGHVQLVPPNPETPQVSGIGQDSMVISWSAVKSASAYQLEVATDDSFSQILAGYPSEITGLKDTVRNLNPGGAYHFRLSAQNSSGVSGYSPHGQVVLVPADPVTMSVTGISESSFTARWFRSAGADKYLLDVSEEEGFQTLLEGYDSREVADTTEMVTGLALGETYFYRVKATNSNGSSDYSDTRSVLLLESPGDLTASNITQTEAMLDWSAVSGASGYLLFVSTSENFDTHIAGYNGKSLTTVSESLADLTAGSQYYWRLQALNNSGISEYSETGSFITVPSSPVISSITSVDSLGFRVSWDHVQGVANYELQVAADGEFTQLIFNETKIHGDSTYFDLSGLEPGTTCFVRMLSKNSSGSSGYSIIESVLLVSGAPDGLFADNLTENSFRVSWGPATGALSYEVQVSETTDFSTLIWESEADESEIQVNGLASGQNYFVRVRSGNESGLSDYSGILSVVTYPQTPVNISFPESGISPDKFTVSWNPVQGAEGYELLISEDDPEFGAENLLAGYQPKALSSERSSEGVSGLKPNTFYWVKLRAFNAAGASAYSAAQLVTTQTTGGGTTDSKPAIRNVSYDAPTQSLSFEATSPLGDLKSVAFRHKAVSEADFSELQITPSEEGSYQVDMKSEWWDMLGLNYQIVVTDLIGQTVAQVGDLKPNIGSLLIRKDNLAFGTSLSNYRIISVPYELDATIGQIFLDNLGKVDHSKWRLVRYENGRNKDYEELSFERLERGKAYWFVSADSLDLNFGQGTVPENTLDKPFELALEKGWNQIGNPYPFEISWTDILAYNENPSWVGTDYLTYGSNGDQFTAEKKVLLPYQGGFVFAEEATTLAIPVDIGSGTGSSGARQLTSSGAAWNLTFSISSGNISNSLSGIGMHPGAVEELDRYDMAKPPGLTSSLHLVSNEKAEVPLVRSIVPVDKEYLWKFQLDNAQEGDPMMLSWKIPPHLAGASLFLYDPSRGHLINMMDKSLYRTDSETEEVFIYYSSEIPDFLSETDLKLGVPYPNPSIGAVTIPYNLSFETDPNLSANLTVYDIEGRVVYERLFFARNRGLNSLTWDGTTTSGVSVESGIYFYQITVNNRTIEGKIIRK